MYVDPSGYHTIAYGFSLSAAFLFGGGISIGLAVDDKGNIALQASHSIHAIDKNTSHISFAGIGIGSYAAYTNLEEVGNLESYSTYVGASITAGASVGVDAIVPGALLGEGENALQPDIVGAQITAGGGIGLSEDFHIISTNTKNLFEFNVYDAVRRLDLWIESIPFLR